VCGSYFYYYFSGKRAYWYWHVRPFLLLLLLAVILQVSLLPSGLQHLWVSDVKARGLQPDGASLLQSVTQHLTALQTLGETVTVGSKDVAAVGQ
jgi:hypothetical protein